MNSTETEHREVDGWRLRNYSHGLATDDPSLKGEAEALQAWIDAITIGIFRSKTAMEALKEMAERKVDGLEAVASQRAFARHAAWLQEGLAKGLGRHHKLSKTAT